MIVVVSFRDDSHADLVEAAFNEAGFREFVRLNFEDSHLLTQFAIEPKGGRFRISTSGVEISSEELKTVWWRRSGTRPTPTWMSHQVETDYTESYWATRWLFESLDESLFPFGHPTRMRKAENKIRQLRVAENCGLPTPHTCISNDRNTLIAFAKRFNSIVVKPLYVTLISDSDGVELPLYASVTSSTRLQSLLTTTTGPVYLFCQERIWKQADIRAIFFPDGNHFACELATSSLPDSEVDWRPDTMKIEHTPIVLPQNIVAAGERFLSEMGIPSGSFDFGVTGNGDWVFFECNPNGQWLWMELKTGSDLGRRFARGLLEHHNRQRNPDTHEQ